MNLFPIIVRDLWLSAGIVRPHQSRASFFYPLRMQTEKICVHLAVEPFNLGPWRPDYNLEEIVVKASGSLNLNAGEVHHGMFGSFPNPDFFFIAIEE